MIIIKNGKEIDTKKDKIELSFSSGDFYRFGFAATLGVMTACTIIAIIIYIIAYGFLKDYIITL